MPRPVVKHIKSRTAERTTRRNKPRVSVEVPVIESNGGESNDNAENDAPLFPSSSPVKSAPIPRTKKESEKPKEKPQPKAKPKPTKAAATTNGKNHKKSAGNEEKENDYLTVVPSTPERDLVGAQAQRGSVHTTDIPIAQTQTHTHTPTAHRTLSSFQDRASVVSGSGSSDGSAIAKTIVPGSATPSEGGSVGSTHKIGLAHRSSSLLSSQRIQKTVGTPHSHSHQHQHQHQHPYQNQHNNYNSNNNHHFDSSMLSNFKTRSRKPSIMHMMEVDLGDDLDDEHFLGSPEPDDESTPVQRRLSFKPDLHQAVDDQQRQEQHSQLRSIEQHDQQDEPDYIPNTQPDDPIDNRPMFSDIPSSPPRRLQDVFGPYPGSEPEPEPANMTSDVVEDDTIGQHHHHHHNPGVLLATPPRPSQPPIDQPQPQSRSHTPEPLTQSMLPPISSSPTPPLSERGDDARGATAAADAATTVAGTKQPHKRQQRKRNRGADGMDNGGGIEHLSTEQLRKVFLPQRKSRRLRNQGVGHGHGHGLEGEDDDDDDDDGDAYSLKSDEDELSFLPTTKPKPKTSRASKEPKGRGRKKATKSVPPPPHEDNGGGGGAGRFQKKAKNTYKSRHSLGDPLTAETVQTAGGEDKENDTPAVDEAATSEKEKAKTRDDELQRQAKKFADVWKWSMDFEDVKESSSPGR